MCKLNQYKVLFFIFYLGKNFKIMTIDFSADISVFRSSLK